MKKIRFFVVITVLFFSISYADDRLNFSSTLEEARRGNVEAMCNLGIAYFYGKEILKDPFKAKCWIQKAYGNGSVRAEKLWEDLELWKFSGKCEASFDDEPLPEYTTGDIFKDPVTGMEFVFIRSGCFMMGCHKFAEKCDKDERPAHKVCINEFWMGKYEVTQELWHRGNMPVEMVGIK